MPKLRIVFMGTAELACPILSSLLAQQDFEIAAVVTQPDRPKGRHLEIQFPPVKQVALGAKLPILQPERARNTQFIDALKQLHPDLIVVVAYGQILPVAILDIPRFGSLNVHTSLLPKYRGAAPIQWALLNDESETGVTIMKMDAGMDTGEIVAQTRTPISREDNGETLHQRLGELGAGVIGPTVREYVEGRLKPHPQPTEGVSYARKISKEDGRIDWTQAARRIWNQVRALAPWPGAFTYQGEQGKQRLVKIWRAAVIKDERGKPGELLQCDKSGILVRCGEDSLLITELQKEGGRRMSAQEFVTGGNLKAGDLLSGAAGA
jgi:methionyl-tRNA formyltransferase